jgi:hypothetical protein
MKVKKGYLFRIGSIARAIPTRRDLSSLPARQEVVKSGWDFSLFRLPLIYLSIYIPQVKLTWGF